MAPFPVEGFRLDSMIVIEDPASYAAWWKTVEASVDRDAARGELSTPQLDVQTIDFLHKSELWQHRSRFRRIDQHSLPRSLSVIDVAWRSTVADLLDGELDERLPASDRSNLAGGDPAAWADVWRDLGPVAVHGLARVFDHGVGLVTADVDLPRGLVVRSTTADDAQPRVLDGLQALGVALGEAAAARLARTVLPALAGLVREVHGADRYLLDTPKEALQDLQGRPLDAGALWVARALVLEDADWVGRGDGVPPAAGPVDDRPVGAAGRVALVRHWLKDVVDADAEIERCIGSRTTSSMRWLNYLLAEGSYDPGHLVAPQVEARQVDDPAAAPYVWPSVEWNAVAVAQYYYAAYDLLQTRISKLLTTSVAGSGRVELATAKGALDGTLRDANSLQHEYLESRKHFSRGFIERFDDTLDGWSFEADLHLPVREQLEACERRLDDLHARSAERSLVYTDFILLAIGITGIFELLFTLATFGRTSAVDPELSYYDRSTWNIANWIGENSTDALIFASGVLSVGLAGLYAYFRARGARM